MMMIMIIIAIIVIIKVTNLMCHKRKQCCESVVPTGSEIIYSVVVSYTVGLCDR